MLDRYRLGLLIYGAAALLLYVAGGERLPMVYSTFLVALAGVSEMVGRAERKPGLTRRPWWKDAKFMTMTVVAICVFAFAVLRLVA